MPRLSPSLFLRRQVKNRANGGMFLGKCGESTGIYLFSCAVGEDTLCSEFRMAARKFNVLPGFGLTMGYTLFYLSAIVLIPIGGLFLRAFNISWADFWRLATTERALAAYRLTFGAAFVAAMINALFGTILAWVLARYQFPGKRLVDALVDFPFALPTAVAGLTLSNLFAANGWLGQYLVPLGIKGAFTPLGVVLALTFVGLPFVVRSLQPVLENLEREIEEAAATLGASRLRTFCSILLPTLLPTIITGFALAFARAIGEYGSVVFISANIPFRTEIAPYLIVMQLEEYNYNGAIALAVVLLVISFALLAMINWLEHWASRYQS
jgi:sulfate/thiosulfate transport system permease protein